jgi:hypothetical protein
LVHKELLDLLEHKEFKDHKELEVHKEFKDFKVQDHKAGKAL